MQVLPLPSVPWQVTGNHWLSLPCIHPADGAIHAVGVLHRGARAAVEFAGSPGFLSGDGPALLRPAIVIGSEKRPLSGERMAWERAVGWLPTYTCTVGSIVVRATIFAPFGRDADVAGAVYAIGVENRSGSDTEVSVVVDGVLGHRQQRVRTARPFDDAHRVSVSADGVILLEGSALPGIAAIAIGSDGEAEARAGGGASAEYSLRRNLAVRAGERAQTAFYLAAGPERDGAGAAMSVMRRRGWRELLSATRDALQMLEQTTGNESVDRLINRNLLFTYFQSVGRALDDAHFYLVRTRVPWHGAGVTVRDWEALAWVFPAILLADSALAREVLLRICELHGYAPGRGAHYFDGTLFEPGFSLEGAAAYALAVDRYIRETGDDEIVDEPVLAETLYLASDDIAARRDRALPLYATEVNPSGAPVPHPFTLHANAVVAQALDVLRRTLDEETARDLEDPEAVRAAIRRHFGLQRESKTGFASAIDLAGNVSADDDPRASALWLPLFEAVERQDSMYRRTVRGLGAKPHYLVEQAARLMGPDADEVLEWLRKAPLDNGLAAEVVDEDGKAVGNGGDAGLAGLIAWCSWYAVHALGVKP